MFEDLRLEEYPLKKKKKCKYEDSSLNTNIFEHEGIYFKSGGHENQQFEGEIYFKL